MITWCGKMSKQVIEPYAFQCKTNIEEHNDMVNKINEIVDVVNELDVEEITKDITALESEVSAQGNEIDALNADVAELPTKAEVANTDVTAVAVDKTSAGIEIQLTRPAGVLEDSVSLPFINTAIDFKACRCFCIADVIHDSLYAYQRLSCPIIANISKHSMFNFIPFRCSWRKMTNCYL